MDTAPITDPELNTLRQRAVSRGPASYQTIVPVLIDEILRLRRVVRRLAIAQATQDDGSAS
jgi:hypothetical protein